MADQPADPNNKKPLPSFNAGVAALGDKRGPVNPKSNTFGQEPSMSEIVAGRNSARLGGPMAEIVSAARLPGSKKELDPDEIKPPPFLSKYQAMKDVFQKVKGRASPKTRELLDSPDLEDMVKLLEAVTLSSLRS
jgi:hypothetical protein